MEQNLGLGRRVLQREVVQGNGERNLDGKMVVLLAALLCALVGAIGVKCIVRCVLRCSSEQRAEEAAARGLKKRDLSQIPVGVYGNDVKMKGTDCGICLGDFEEGEKVRMLPICNHGFHLTCIDTWLLSHSSCPNCRRSLLH